MAEQRWVPCACGESLVRDVMEVAQCRACEKRWQQEPGQPWGPCPACGAVLELQRLQGTCVGCDQARSRSRVAQQHAEAAAEAESLPETERARREGRRPNPFGSIRAEAAERERVLAERRGHDGLEFRWLGALGVLLVLIGLYFLVLDPGVGGGSIVNLQKLFIGSTLTLSGFVLIAAEWRPR